MVLLLRGDVNLKDIGGMGRYDVKGIERRHYWLRGLSGRLDPDHSIS